MGNALVFTVTTPWWLPHLACDDHLSDDTYFPCFPYEAGHDGYLIINPLDPLNADQVSIRASSEFGADFDDLSRIGTRVNLDTSSRFGLDTEWNQWIEQTGTGDDRLATGDFNLVYRFAQNERIQFRSGLGFNWLADSQAADFGFNFTYGVDVFPSEPFIVSGTLDLGSLGEALFFHVHTTAGVIVGPAELFTGYDYQRIGNVDLHGLLAGIQLWF